MAKQESAPELQLEQPQGIEIAPGRFKTSQGTIVVPRSRQKKLAQQAARERGETIQDGPPSFEAPRQEVKEPSVPEINTGTPEKVTFTTPMGNMSAVYNPVIDLPDWVVLGTTPQSFVPVSYKENKELSFDLESNSIKKCKVVYTGCKFQEPMTRTVYIVLMKVGGV